MIIMIIKHNPTNFEQQTQLWQLGTTAVSASGEFPKLSRMAKKCGYLAVYCTWDLCGSGQTDWDTVG